MQEHTSLRIVRPPGEQRLSEADRPARPVTAEDKRALFRGLVIHCLDAGFLRYSRRQELLKIAEQLGIGEFEACLLIAEAQFHSDQIEPAHAGDIAGFDVTPIARTLSSSFMRIASATLVAAAVDLAIIFYLL